MAFSAADTAANALAVPQAGRNYLDTLANKYVVKPKFVRGIGGFVFDYEGETNVRLQSDITDHVMEDGSSTQDHIALKPGLLTLRGFVAELVVAKPTGLIGALETIQARLGTVPAYLGKYTPGALAKIEAAVTKAETIANTVDTALARAQNIIGLFSGAGPGSTKQNKAYLKLKALRASKQVFTVDTPYGVMENMTIQDISWIQPEDTKFQSDVTIVLKAMQFVETQSATDSSFSGRAGAQRSNQANLGKTSGTPVTRSLMSTLLFK